MGFDKQCNLDMFGAYVFFKKFLQTTQHPSNGCAWFGQGNKTLACLDPESAQASRWVPASFEISAM
eukprot:6444518-Ditylum_brightwellii.AAC.1